MILAVVAGWRACGKKGPAPKSGGGPGEEQGKARRTKSGGGPGEEPPVKPK